MQRPTGFTLLGLAAGFLAVGGLAVAWFSLTGSSSAASPVLGLIALVYATTAGATATGLWRCRNWAVQALRVWVAAFIVFVAGFVYLYKSMFADSAAAIAVFLLVVLLLSWLLDKYVRGRFAAG